MSRPEKNRRFLINLFQAKQFVIDPVASAGSATGRMGFAIVHFVPTDFSTGVRKFGNSANDVILIHRSKS
jgi:hypothetical protein